MESGSRGGLEDVVVSTSDICFIDGKEGRLVYRGFDVNDLVEHSSFEEVIFLLWHGGLPSKKELVAHTKAISSTATRKLPPGLVTLLKVLGRLSHWSLIFTSMSHQAKEPSSSAQSRIACT